MVRLHVHVYRVVAKAEVDLEVVQNGDGRSVDRALEDVLVRARDGRLAMGPSDCQYLVLPYHSDEEHDA